jgi:hypothetical protein
MYKIKDSIKFDAIQWQETSSASFISRFCVGWLMKTHAGTLRVNKGNYVVQGPSNFRLVLDPDTFNQVFEKVD